MAEVMKKLRSQKYPAYKDSGVEWLGEMPEHWEALSNKYIFNLQKTQVGKKAQEYTLLSLTLNGIIKRDMENPQGKFPAEFDTYQEVKQGDFLFCLFDVEETPRAVGLSSFDGMITGAYTVMELKDGFSRKFIYYYYLNLDADKRMKPLYKGLRNVISKEAFFTFKTFVPPIKEQTAIAAFLDRKTTQIDKAISQKEAQIELLKERRQILIHRAVTRGLDPSVKMKDSGVEWVGEVPQNWIILRMNFVITSIKNGVWGSDPVEDSDTYCIRVSDFDRENLNISTTNLTLRKISLDELESRSLHAGDLLLEKSGGGENTLVGQVVLYTLGLKAVCSNFVARLRVKDGFDNNYINYAFSCLYANKVNYLHLKQTTGIQNLDMKAYLNEKIAFPSYGEQLIISKYLDRKLTQIRKVCNNKILEIKKLKEYKATLINAAVTGKIKVS